MQKSVSPGLPEVLNQRQTCGRMYFVFSCSLWSHLSPWEHREEEFYFCFLRLRLALDQKKMHKTCGLLRASWKLKENKCLFSKSSLIGSEYGEESSALCDYVLSHFRCLEGMLFYCISHITVCKEVLNSGFQIYY